MSIDFALGHRPPNDQGQRIGPPRVTFDFRDTRRGGPNPLPREVRRFCRSTAPVGYLSHSCNRVESHDQGNHTQAKTDEHAKPSYEHKPEKGRAEGDDEHDGEQETIPLPDLLKFR